MNETFRCRQTSKARSMKPMLAEIQAAVCQYYGLHKTDMMSTSRRRAIARPRQIGMFLAREMTVRSLAEIGNALGGMDHTTVIHGVRSVRRLMDEVPEIARDVRACRQLAIHIAMKRAA